MPINQFRTLPKFIQITRGGVEYGLPWAVYRATLG